MSVHAQIPRRAYQRARDEKRIAGPKWTFGLPHPMRLLDTPRSPTRPRTYRTMESMQCRPS